MQQIYAGKDVTRFIAAILWIVMGIIYVTYVFDILDGFSALKQYKRSGKLYGQMIGYYWFMLVVYVTAAVIVVMAAVFLFKEDVNKFGTAMYCFAAGYIITVIVAVIYLSAISNGSIKEAFSYYLGSSFEKYLVVFGIMMILVVSSIIAQGINYKKAASGVTVGGKSFVPLGIYLSSLICIFVIAGMLKDDFGQYVNVSQIFGNAIKSQSGGGIALIVGVHFASGLYIFLREKFYLGGGYGSYGNIGYGAPMGMTLYGQTGYVAPMGMPPYGQTGYGAPMGMPPYGQTGYGAPMGMPPYGQTGYGAPMGMPPYGQSSDNTQTSLDIKPKTEENKNEQKDEIKNDSIEMSQNIKYCSKCGTKLDSGAKFCYKCGSRQA